VSAGRRAGALLLLVLLAGAIGAPPLARADGDPASDVLIKERAFYPYEIKLPAASTKALTDTLTRAKEQGFPIRVAMIARDFDLGSAGLLYRKPKPYAQFLAQELAMFNTDWLLVVMPNGYGLYHCLPKQQAAGYSDPCEANGATGADEKLLAALPTQERSRQDFAAAGDVAVRRLAEAHGASFGGGLLKPLVGVVVLLLLVVGGGFVFFRRRQRPAIAKPPEGIEIET
jgi:hypothetical protein